MPTYLGLEVGSLGGDDKLESQNSTLARNKTIKQCHIVLADSLNDNEDTILAQADIPVIASLLRGATLRRRRADEIDVVINPATGTPCGLWRVECEYDSSVDSEQAQNSGSSNGNPVNQRPKRRWRTNKVSELIEADAFTGFPIQTTAGEPIHIEDDIPHPVLEITRIEPYPFNPQIKYLFENHTNDDPFYGAPPGCALMDEINTSEIVIENQDYVEATYSIEFRVVTFRPFNLVNVFLPDGWDIQVPNIGYLYLPRAKSNTGEELNFVNPGTKPVTFIDANGQPQKVRLREDGSLAGPDDPDVFIDVARKIRTPFGPLNLEY